jgi:hypothetical protein
MNTTMMSIELSNEQLTMIAELMQTRKGKTVEQMVQECLEFGIENKLYRTRRNKEVYAASKSEKDVVAQLRKELAELKASAQQW